MKEIVLGGKWGKGRSAKVDDKDFDYLNQFSWHAKKDRNTFYAIRAEYNNGQKNILMHREILNAPKGIQVDHINLDGLNNIRSNLRLCTLQQNQWNRGKRKNTTSIYKGVTWNKLFKKWQAYIKVNGKNIYLGRYKTEAAAGKAYDKGAKKYFGVYAYTNFKST